MGFLTPFSMAFRAVNTIGTVYLCGSVGVEVYKKIRVMRKESLTARQLRERFVAEYTDKLGEEPSEKEIQIALASYNAIENPLQHRMNGLITEAGEKIENLVSGKWLETEEKPPSK